MLRPLPRSQQSHHSIHRSLLCRDRSAARTGVARHRANRHSTGKRTRSILAYRRLPRQKRRRQISRLRRTCGLAPVRHRMRHSHAQPAEINIRRLRCCRIIRRRRSCTALTNRNRSVESTDRRTHPRSARSMQQHQQSLSNAVTLIVPCPKACPLAQNVRSPHSASADGLVDPKLDLDHSLIGTPDRQHLPRKDDIGLIRHLVQNIDDSLWRRNPRGLTAGQRALQQPTNRQRAHQETSSQKPAHVALRPLLVFRQKKSSGQHCPVSEHTTPEPAG